jgi:hypothetical protein
MMDDLTEFSSNVSGSASLVVTEKCRLSDTAA